MSDLEQKVSELRRKPIKSKIVSGVRCYRPIDVVARARAWRLSIDPPREKVVKESIETLTEKLNSLKRQYDQKKHELSIVDVSLRSCGAVLLSSEEIIQDANPLPNFCGIYFLIHEDEIIYVGQSLNVITRITQHINEGMKIFDRYALITCLPEDMDVLESLYIHSLRPSQNSKGTKKGFILAPLSIERLMELNK